ncbi:hypothetical protein IJT17_09055 [bacterium]|nr:hypothetical protein [bacterium]
MPSVLYAPSASPSLNERYFLESFIWRRLDRPTPFFEYVQDPIFNLTPTEVGFLEHLHRLGLRFTLRPRYDPSSFIHLRVTLARAQQTVRIEVYPDMALTCVFITERNEFAEEFKGWLDRNLGSEHFAANNYVATRRFVHYPYILPVSPELIENFSTIQKELRERIRSFTLFFNFSAKEKHFLEIFEQAVKWYGSQSPDPVFVQVYPRQTKTGSLEIVANNSKQRQPARIFISGYHPVAYQMITENTALGEQLHQCLDHALSADSFDAEASRMRGSYISLIYNVRYSLDLLDSFEEDEDADE